MLPNALHSIHKSLAYILKNIITISILLIISFGCVNNVIDEKPIEIISEKKLKEYKTVVVNINDLGEFKYSEKYFEWKNPTTGGAIHINKNDEIELYQSFHWGNINDSCYFENISIEDDDFHIKINGIGLGNPPSVLLTSELDINKSVSFKNIVRKLNEGAYLIYMIK